MWNPFKKKPVVVEEFDSAFPTTYEFPVKSVVLKKTIVIGEWRTGMWVVYDNQIGILHKIVDSSGEVHLVDPETGYTVLEKLVPLSALRQSKYNEIPPPRRLTFTALAAREYGYGD